MRANKPGRPEGERFHVDRQGHLVAVNVALWVDPLVSYVNVEVWGPRCGELERRALVVVPATAFPTYVGVGYWTQVESTRIAIEPPVPIRAGETIDVVFEPAQGTCAACYVSSDNDSFEDTFHHDEGSYFHWDLEHPNGLSMDFVARIEVDTW